MKTNILFLFALLLFTSCSSHHYFFNSSFYSTASIQRDATFGESNLRIMNNKFWSVPLIAGIDNKGDKSQIKYCLISLWAYYSLMSPSKLCIDDANLNYQIILEQKNLTYFRTLLDEAIKNISLLNNPLDGYYQNSSTKIKVEIKKPKENEIIFEEINTSFGLSKEGYVYKMTLNYLLDTNPNPYILSLRLEDMSKLRDDLFSIEQYLKTL